MNRKLRPLDLRRSTLRSLSGADLSVAHGGRLADPVNTRGNGCSDGRDLCENMTLSKPAIETHCGF